MGIDQVEAVIINELLHFIEKLPVLSEEVDGMLVCETMAYIGVESLLVVVRGIAFVVVVIVQFKTSKFNCNDCNKTYLSMSTSFSF